MTQSVLVGLIGTGIQASRSPALHEAEGAAQGLSYQYKLIDLTRLGLAVDALPDLLTAAERLGFDGLNITHPCKQAVIRYLDELSPDAQALGAVNTVLLGGGRRVGHNTDWFGFAEGFRRGLPHVRLDRVVQFGAGGAGSAVAHAALTLGVRHLTLIDVDPGRARAVAERIDGGRIGGGRIGVGDSAAAAIATADGIINATPLGMDDHPGMAFPASLLRPDLWVAEIVYFPLETELLRQARALGCRTVDGGGMAVFQAVEAFRLFSGVVPDAARMRRHFLSMG
jgi:shikimate dehydrogenase